MSEEYVKLEDVKNAFTQDALWQITDANELSRQILSRQVLSLPIYENLVEVTLCEKCKYHDDAPESLSLGRDKYVICKVHNMYKKMTDFCSDGAEEDGDG